MPNGAPRRRRSSLAQLTDILREWSGGVSKRANKPLNRRETLADLARSLPWGARTSNDSNTQTISATTITAVTGSMGSGGSGGIGGGGGGQALKKRRESSAEVSSKNSKSRRDSHSAELTKLWSSRRESPNDRDRDREKEREDMTTDTRDVREYNI